MKKTVKLVECMDAYSTILKMGNEKMDFSTAHAFAMAKRELAPHAEFFSSQEKEIVERYAMPFEDGSFLQNGKYRIHSDNTQAFKADMNALNDVEVEVDIVGKVKNPPNLSIAEMESLMPFFDFPVE